MTTVLSVRDALLEVRRFVSEDQERATRIQELLTELNEAVNDRVSATNKVVEDLDGLVSDVGAVLGFGPGSDSPVPETERRSQRPTKKQKTSLAQAPVGVMTDANIDQAIDEINRDVNRGVDLSDIETNVLNVLRARYPKFTTAGQLAKEGALTDASYAGPTITRLRKKNVPIESAKQARENDPNIRLNTSGWRLIVS